MRYNNQMAFLKNFVPDFVANEVNKLKMAVSEKLYPPPEQDVFQVSGKLSPDEFRRAGQKLIAVCKGWQWKPSLNPKQCSKHFNADTQFLMLERAVSRKRIRQILYDMDEKVIKEGEDEVIVLNSHPEKEEPERAEDIRYYNMYIVYDEGYHVPRMYFNAVDFNLQPIPNEALKEDIQKEYIDKTLTIESFPYLEGVSMPTVHPCKHANVLKTMSDSMIEGGQKVQSHFALLIFLKFITSVIPTVEFDFTGDLIFQ